MKYKIRNKTEYGKRSLEIWLDVKVRSYVRQTRGSRYRTDSHGKYVREYNDNQGMLRDVFNLLMEKENIIAFGKVPLGCSVVVEGPTCNRPDLSNYIKAVEDAANHSLWIDDRYVQEFGECRKIKAEEDKLYIKIWEL